MFNLFYDWINFRNLWQWEVKAEQYRAVNLTWWAE